MNGTQRETYTECLHKPVREIGFCGNLKDPLNGLCGFSMIALSVIG